MIGLQGIPEQKVSLARARYEISELCTHNDEFRIQHSSNIVKGFGSGFFSYDKGRQLKVI